MNRYNVYRLIWDVGIILRVDGVRAEVSAETLCRGAEDSLGFSYRITPSGIEAYVNPLNHTYVFIDFG